MRKFSIFSQNNNAAATGASAASGYGSGNTSVTSKTNWLNSGTTDSGTAFALADAQALADTPISQLAPDPTLFPTGVGVSNQSSTNWQAFVNGLASNSFTPVVEETAGFINGVGNSFLHLISHPIANTEILFRVIGDVISVDFCLDTSGESAARLNNVFNGIQLVYQSTQNVNPIVRGNAWDQVAFTVGSLVAAPETANFMGDLGEIGSGLIAQEVGLAVPTPYGYAFQSFSNDSAIARDVVANGAQLYRAGTLGISQSSEIAQFWTTLGPQTTPNYPQIYGLPPQNAYFNFFSQGSLNPGVNFITRPVPGFGINSGGAVEVVTSPGNLSLIK